MQASTTMNGMVMHASDLGIDLSKGSPQSLYRWLVASMLFGRPVQQEVGAEAYRALMRHKVTSPARFGELGREQLRAILDEARYARIDYIMTDELHDVMRGILDDYGSVSKLVRTSGSRSELSKRLQAYKGIGPKTVEIYLRDIPQSVV